MASKNENVVLPLVVLPVIDEAILSEESVPDVAVVTAGKLAPFKGIILAGLLGFIISINSSLTKTLYSMNAAELILFQYIGAMLYSLPCLFYYNVKLKLRAFAYILAARSFVSVACHYLRTIGIQTLVLTDSNVMAISNPVFVAFFERILLKERVNRAAAIALVCTVTGVAIVSKFWTFSSDADSEHIIGTFSILGSIALSALVMIFIRKMSVSGVHASAIVFHHGWMSGLIAVAFTAATDGYQLLECDWWGIFGSYHRLVLVGMFSFVGQMLVNLASQYEKATTVSLVMCSVRIACIFIWQYLIFEKVPSLFAYLGAVFVLCGSFILYFSIWVKTWDDRSTWKKRLLCITK